MATPDKNPIDCNEKILQLILRDYSLEKFIEPEIIDILTKWIEKSKSISILIAGKTGTGKSTLINAILGKSVAKVGKTLKPETRKVRMYRQTVDDVEIKLYDSPGLQDGTANEEQYIAEIHNECSDVDLFIYCIRMSETRFFPGCPDAIAMNRISRALGERVWKNGLIVFTFANDVVTMAEAKRVETTKYFRAWTDKLVKKIKTFLQEEVRLPPELVTDLTVVPAGHPNQPLLPSIDEPSSSGSDIHWLSNLWLKALRRTRHDAQPAITKLNFHRILTKEKEYSLQELLDTAAEIIGIQPIILSLKGAEICKELGDDGERIGSAIGRRVATYRSEDILGKVLNTLAVEHGII